MINRPLSVRARKYARRLMFFNNSKHAIYGITYVEGEGAVVSKFAESPNKIRYFQTDGEYEDCIKVIAKEYGNIHVHIHAVHREEYPVDFGININRS